MPVEERFISFDLDEVYKAVNILCIKDDMEQPPKARLISIEADPANENGGDNILLKITREDNGAKEELKYERKFFAMALVFLCQTSGIPLPKRGTKTLKVLEDKIIMKIDLESQPQPTQLAASLN